MQYSKPSIIGKDHFNLFTGNERFFRKRREKHSLFSIHIVFDGQKKKKKNPFKYLY